MARANKRSLDVVIVRDTTRVSSSWDNVPHEAEGKADDQPNCARPCLLSAMTASRLDTSYWNLNSAVWTLHPMIGVLRHRTVLSCAESCAHSHGNWR